MLKFLPTGENRPVLGKMEDFLDQHAVDSIKSRLESMIGRDEDPVGIDGAVIHFMGEVMLLRH